MLAHKDDVIMVMTFHSGNQFSFSVLRLIKRKGASARRRIMSNAFLRRRVASSEKCTYQEAAQILQLPCIVADDCRTSDQNPSAASPDSFFSCLEKGEQHQRAIRKLFMDVAPAERKPGLKFPLRFFDCLGFSLSWAGERAVMAS